MARENFGIDFIEPGFPALALVYPSSTQAKLMRLWLCFGREDFSTIASQISGNPVKLRR